MSSVEDRLAHKTEAPHVLSSRAKFRRRDVHCPVLSVYRAMPHTASERGDIDFCRIRGIRNDPVPPLEAKSRNAVPVGTTIR